MSHRRPSLPLVVPLAIALVLGLAGCGAIGEARDSADRTKDCAALAAKLTGLKLDAESTQADIQRAINELEDAIDNLSNDEVRRAAQALDRDVKDLQKKARNTDQADIDKAVAKVRADAETLARTCNVPVDQILSR